MIHIAVIDDEEQALRRIEERITSILNEQSIDVETDKFINGNDFLRENTLNGYDIAFIDLEMPEIDGFELSEKLRDSGYDMPIVYVTNRDDLVYDAFRYKAVGFIRKAHLDDELPDILMRLTEEIRRNKTEITLTSGTGVYKISTDDIVYMCSEDHDTVFHIKNGECINIRTPLSSYIGSEHFSGFMLVGVSFYVNSSYIYSIEKDELILEGGERIRIPRRRIKEVKDEFLRLMRE